MRWALQLQRDSVALRTDGLQDVEQIDGKVFRVVLVGPAVLAEKGHGRIFDPAEASALNVAFGSGSGCRLLSWRLMMAKRLEEKLEEGFALKVGGQDVPASAAAPLLAKKRPEIQGRHDAIQKGRCHGARIPLEHGQAKFCPKIRSEKK